MDRIISHRSLPPHRTLRTTQFKITVPTLPHLHAILHDIFTPQTARITGFLLAKSGTTPDGTPVITVRACIECISPVFILLSEAVYAHEAVTSISVQVAEKYITERLFEDFHYNVDHGMPSVKVVPCGEDDVTVDGNGAALCAAVSPNPARGSRAVTVAGDAAEAGPLGYSKINTVQGNDGKFVFTVTNQEGGLGIMKETTLGCKPTRIERNALSTEYEILRKLGETQYSGVIDKPR